MSAVPSPLFEPVLWLGDGFKVLDETQVPEKIEYFEVRDTRQAIDAVREMKTRAFGQVLTFLYSAALSLQRCPDSDVESLRRTLAELTRQFCAARPTFDFRGLEFFVNAGLSELPAGSDARAAIAKHARELGQQIVRGRIARAKLTASVLPDEARVLTHCNISGELVAVAQYCKEVDKKFSVVATETRPYLQGARLTAWELAQAGVAVSVIPDCAIAQVMKRGEVNAAVVGADRSAQNGDIVNKVGTYPLAVMAKDFGIPFYVLVQDPRSLVRGCDVAIEERPAAELLIFQGHSLVGSDSGGLSVRYPAFDITPAALITRLIGFDDIYTLETFRRKYQKQSIDQSHSAARRGKYLLVYGVPPTNQYPYLASALKAVQAESVLVPEMRPALWGTEVIVPELLERRVSATLISDNMMGALFARGEINKLCLFYHTLTDQGPRGICGSELAVRLARRHGVEVELFSGLEEGKAPRDRDAGTFLGRNLCPAGARVHAIGPEVVPWSLLKN
jgi:methylthioribose-1-phosphate isomerase